jgi:hypothetical protein
MKPPKGFTFTESYVDWVGNTVRAQDTVLIGQRDGNGSRMWIGEVVAIAEHHYTEQRWTGRRDAQGKGIFDTVPKVEHSVLIQPVSGSLYSPHSSRHHWELKMDWNDQIVRDERGNALFDDTKRPKPTWTKAEFVVRYPKEFLP